MYNGLLNPMKHIKKYKTQFMPSAIYTVVVITIHMLTELIINSVGGTGKKFSAYYSAGTEKALKK